MMHRRSPAILALVSILAGLVIVACKPNFLSQSDPTAMPPPSSGDHVAADVISAEGVVVPYQEADLSFQVPGRVQTILVTEGDVVTLGQELARLESWDLEQAVLEAEAGLKLAQSALAKARAGSRPEEGAIAEAAVSIARSRVNVAEKAVVVAESNQAAAQIDIQAAEDAVNVAQGNLAAANAALSSAQASLTKLQAGATARDIEMAEGQVDLAKAELWRMELKADALGLSKGEIGAAGTAVEIAELEVAKLKDPPRAEDLAGAQATVSQAQADVQTAKAELEQAQVEIGKAEARVLTAESQVAQAQAEVENANAGVVKALAALDLVKAGTRQEDIDVAQAAVSQVESVLVEAQNALEDAVLTAPFGGTVGIILADEGELIPAQGVVIHMGDMSQLRVETEDLSEVDIDQVSVGQEAAVTVDALEGETFPGTISRIAPVAEDYRGDTVYTVLVDLGVGPESGLRWGMSTFVEIQVR